MKGALLFIMALFGASACSDGSKTTPNQKVSQRITPLVSTKTMVEIKGGKYQGFIGKDSGRVNTVQAFLLDCYFVVGYGIVHRSCSFCV